MIAKLAISAVWILASALLFRLLSVWDQLPERVAVHFGVSMQPDGWGRKSTAAWLIVLLVIGHGVLTTWLLLAHGQGNGMLAVIQLATATVFFSIFWQMISFNTQGKPLKAVWIILPVLLIVGSIAASLSGTLFHSVR
jgi:uncharacterized membrane protein